MNTQTHSSDDGHDVAVAQSLISKLDIIKKRVMEPDWNYVKKKFDEEHSLDRFTTRYNNIFRMILRKQYEAAFDAIEAFATEWKHGDPIPTMEERIRAVHVKADFIIFLLDKAAAARKPDCKFHESPIYKRIRGIQDDLTPVTIDKAEAEFLQIAKEQGFENVQ